MSRETFIWDKEKKEFVPYEKPKKNIEVHNVITDEMPGLKHPMSNRIYTSKRRFREETRVRGGIEVGTEKLPDPDKRICVDNGNRKQAVIEAYRIEKENAWRRRNGGKPVDRPWDRSRERE